MEFSRIERQVKFFIEEINDETEAAQLAAEEFTELKGRSPEALALYRKINDALISIDDLAECIGDALARFKEQNERTAVAANGEVS